MLQIDGKKIEGIYYGVRKIDKYYFNGVMYEFYKPYIDYKWSDTVTINNNREIKNSGSFNQDLQLFYGQGVKFNGVDQNIIVNLVGLEDKMTLLVDIPLSTAASNQYYIQIAGNIIWKATNLFRFYDGAKNVELGTYPSGTQIGRVALIRNGNNYNIYINGALVASDSGGVFPLESVLRIGSGDNTAFSDVTMSNIIITKEILSLEQINYYNSKPEDFIYREDNILKSNCGLDLGKVIAWFPMCEKDNYIRDEKNYTEKEKTVDINNASLVSANSNTRIGQQNIGLMIEANKIYEIVYDFLPNANFVEFKLYIPPTSNGGTAIVVAIPVSSFPGRYIFRVPSTYSQTNGITSCYIWIGVNGNKTTHLFKEISLKEITGIYPINKITGIYPINNYTADSRLNARRLTSGLQTCFLNRDSLGRYLSINRDGIVGDGVGYANTRYVSPLNIVPETIEAIIVKPKTIQASFNKYVCGGGGTTDMVIEISSGSDTNGVIRMRKVSIYFQAQHWLPTNVMHIAAVCDGINIFIYINSILIGTYAAQAYTTSHPFKLGIEHGSTGGIADNRGIDTGKIRLFRVHQKALTQAEVTKNFSNYESKGLLAENI